MANFSRKGYWTPTPKKIRKIGLAIASLGASIGAGSGIYLHFEKFPKYESIVIALGIGGPILGWLGKEITNFWTDEATDNSGN